MANLSKKRAKSAAPSKKAEETDATEVGETNAKKKKSFLKRGKSTRN